MSELLNYLNSPHLVANFQKVFGIESHFDSSNKTYLDEYVATTSVKSNAARARQIENKTHNNKSNGLNSAATNLTQKNLNINGNHNNNNKFNSIKIKHDSKLNKEDEKSSLEDVNSKQKQQSNENLVSNGNGINKKISSQHKRTSSNTKTFVNNTDHTHIIANTTIHSRFWYYMFCLGAAMGNEVFYCLFFPFWFWNVDGAIARKVGFLWGIFMYVGQATKDLMCMPRPASPPVVKLEERYVAEYGFPSTHAMVSAGLPISLVVLSYSRYNINLYYSVSLACFFCCWVCCSRLYLGMHSLLDVIAGVLYSILVLILVLPILEPVDNFMLENNFSPFIALTCGYLMCMFYPSLRQWSTARGDTTIIIGTVVGFSVGSFLNNKMGFLHRPDEPPLYNIIFPTILGYLFGVFRTILGLLMLVATRQIGKTSLLRFLCYLNKMSPGDPSCKKEKKIELPYNYLTYFAVGLNIAFTSPYLFRLLNIERDYSYTEL